MACAWRAAPEEAGPRSLCWLLRVSTFQFGFFPVRITQWPPSVVDPHLGHPCPDSAASGLFAALELNFSRPSPLCHAEGPVHHFRGRVEEAFRPEPATKSVTGSSHDAAHVKTEQATCKELLIGIQYYLDMAKSKGVSRFSWGKSHLLVYVLEGEHLRGDEEAGHYCRRIQRVNG